jgi:DNA invertase Pin-like site-specific DNA recombinase
MLAEVDQIDVLIVRDLDRFSRRLAIYATAVDTLIEANVVLYEFVGDGTGIRQLDLTDGDDRALADVKAVFAQMENAKIKRRVRQAKQARAKAGLHPGGKCPYGYRYSGDGDSRW